MLKSKECFEKVLEPIYKVYEEIIIQSEKQKAKKSLTTINMYFQLFKSVCKRYDIKFNNINVIASIDKENTRIKMKESSLTNEIDSADEEYSEENDSYDSD